MESTAPILSRALFPLSALLLKYVYKWKILFWTALRGRYMCWDMFSALFIFSASTFSHTFSGIIVMKTILNAANRTESVNEKRTRDEQKKAPYTNHFVLTFLHFSFGAFQNLYSLLTCSGKCVRQTFTTFVQTLIQSKGKRILSTNNDFKLFSCPTLPVRFAAALALRAIVRQPLILLVFSIRIEISLRQLPIFAVSFATIPIDSCSNPSDSIHGLIVTMISFFFRIFFLFFF